MFTCPLCGKEAEMVEEPLNGTPVLRCSECGQIVALP